MRVYTDVLLLALLLPLQIANTLDSQARDDNLDDNLNVARRIREGTTNSDRLFCRKGEFSARSCATHQFARISRWPEIIALLLFIV